MSAHRKLLIILQTEQSESASESLCIYVQDGHIKRLLTPCTLLVLLPDGYTLARI